MILLGMIFTIYGIRATGKMASPGSRSPGKEASMTFLISTCELPDRADLADEMWQRLAAEFDKSPVDLLVLPELAGVDSFWSSPTFDEAVWRQAAAIHANARRAPAAHRGKAHRGNARRR